MVVVATISAVGGAAGAATASPEFISSATTDQQGDVVRIGVRMQGDSSTTVRIIGRESDYEAAVTVRDGNNDGKVLVEFNTYFAGTEKAFGTVHTSDKVGAVSQSGVDGLLPAGRYRLSIADTRAVSELRLRNRSTESVTTMVAPEGAFGDLRTRDDVDRYREAGNLTERPADGMGAVAVRDTLVLRIGATGLSGAVAARAGSNDSERLQALLDSEEVTFEVVQTNPTVEREPARLLLDREGVRTVAAPGRDAYYVVVNTTAVHYRRGDASAETGLRPGVRFEVNVSVDPSSKLATADSDGATGRFEVVERTASFRTHEEAGESYLKPAGDQAVNGTTTVAPGTRIEVTARGDGGFEASRTVTVERSNGSGTVAARFDLSGLPEGSTVEVTASDHHGGLTGDPYVVTVRSPSARLENPSLVVEDRRLHAKVRANLSRGGLVTVRAHNASGRLLGVAAVEPESGGVTVPLSDLPPKDTPLVVTAVRDLDGDGELTPDVDVPYEESRSDRPEQVTVALYRLPPSPTPTPTDGGPTDTPTATTASPTGSSPDGSTDSPTDTTSTTEPPGDGDGPLPIRTPGFGLLAALAALGAAVVLMVRRE